MNEGSIEWFEKYLDENGFEEVAEGMYECPGGHIWSEWMIKSLIESEKILMNL